MKNKIIISLFSAIAILGLVSFVLYKQTVSLRLERDKYKGNANALLSDIRHMRVDSATTAANVKVLRLSLDEYKQYRADDLETIKKLDIRLKSIQSVSKHEVEVDADIIAEIKDTIVVRDTIVQVLKKVEMNTPYLQVNGIIDNNQLIGKIHLPVNLHQVVWVEHKHRFLWWRWGVKAVHQTISSDNPHVQIKYSEVIQITK